MDDLEVLYQEMMIEHSRQPRNFGKVENATCSVKGYNPICGDKVQVSVRVNDGVVEDVRFHGAGCAISMASASVMTELVMQQPVEEALRRFEVFHSLVTGKQAETLEEEELEDMLMFAGLKNYPIRVKCATLAWHALQNAVQQKEEDVSNE